MVIYGLTHKKMKANTKKLKKKKKKKKKKKRTKTIQRMSLKNCTDGLVI